jgi:hypothetical protein
MLTSDTQWKGNSPGSNAAGPGLCMNLAKADSPNRFQGAFIGIAWMCQFQVVVLGYITFKRFSGLYFWSICSATIAVFIFTLGVVLYHFELGNRLGWLSSLLVTVGYLAFIPSEYSIIYSRSESCNSIMNLLIVFI